MAESVRERVEDWRSKATVGQLRVLLLVSQSAAGQVQVGADLRRWFGPESNVLGTSAPADVPEPYNGFLEVLLGPGQDVPQLLQTLPPAVRDAPHALLPRAFAQSTGHLARVRQRLWREPATWILAPADGLTAGGQRLLEDLGELAPGMGEHVPRFVLTLSLPSSGDLMVALRRRLGDDAVTVVDVGDAEESAPAPAVSPGARALLELLAVSPCPVPVDVLAHAMDADAGSLQSDLRALTAAGLLVERARAELGRGPVRREVLASLDAAALASVHGRLAMGHGRAGSPPGLVAYHEARGPDPGRAVGPLVEAAARCRTLGERELAHEALRHAYLHLQTHHWYRRLEILEQTAETLTEMGHFHEALQAQEEIAELASVYGDEDRPERQCRIARSYLEIGRFDDASRALDRAEALSPSPASRAPALALRAEIALARGDALQASRHVEDGLALAGLPERLRMELLELAFRVAYAEGRMDEAMQCCQRLLEEATAADDGRLVGAAHNGLGHVYYTQSFFDDALSHYQEAVRCAEARGDRSMVSGLLVNVGVTHYEKGDLDRALEVLTRARRLKEREGDLRGVASALNNLGAVHEARGERHAVVELVTQALEIVRDLKDESAEATLCANLAGTYALLGRPGAAREMLKRTGEIAHRTGSPALLASLAQSRAEVALGEGDWDAAARDLETARRLLEDLGARIQEAMALQGMSHAAFMAGDAARASRLAGEAVAIATEVGHPGQIARSRLTLAQATLKRAPLRAEALAREATGDGAPMQDPDFRAQQCYVLGRALLAQGKGKEGRPLLADAARLLTEAALGIPEDERAAFLAHPTRAHILDRARRLADGG